jgi:tRNA(His) 5'-end guanylyltransferase
MLSQVNERGWKMKFDDLDKRMRVFETAHDHCILPGIFAVARLDGRGFTRLTKEVHKFEAPFDERFRDLMLKTTEELVKEFDVYYAYTHSDEISLLFPQEFDLFNRKLRKLESVMAGKASATFSMALGSEGIFDCRICQLPSKEDVYDYFRWRNSDACRNALNSHCYWLMRKQGQTARQATARMDKMRVSDKNEFLFENGINFNDLPAWQKRGSAVYWESYLKEGKNPKTEEKTVCSRRRIVRNLALPDGDAYCSHLNSLFY